MKKIFVLNIRGVTVRQIKIIQTITNRDSKNLEKYFNDVSKIEMLTPKAEVIFYLMLTIWAIIFRLNRFVALS